MYDVLLCMPSDLSTSSLAVQSHDLHGTCPNSWEIQVAREGRVRTLPYVRVNATPFSFLNSQTWVNR
jgi:hypothetical protein